MRSNAINFCNICVILTICTTSSTHNFYFIAISKFDTISTIIINITVSKESIITTSSYSQTAQFTFNISALEISSFIACIISKVLNVFNHTGIFPVFINLAGQPDTRTQVSYITVAIISFCFLIYIAETSFASDFYVVRFFLQSCNANAKAIQLISKFSCQTVYVSAFGHCFCYDLCHFVTGHQTIATESAVAITINDTSCCQFVYGIICPMTCRYIGEGVCSIGRSSYAQSHSHC